MTATVVVTSFRRPEPLAACLAGLHVQTRPPDEIVVVLHASDEFTILEPGPRVVRVTTPGSVAALNAGLDAAESEIVAIVDDDAVPAPDWLERVLDTFARDERIAGVGGRDIVHQHGRVLGLEEQGLLGRYRGTPRVGRIQWFGRMVGNHHIGAGPARDVDVLKGVNMAFRRAEVTGHGFDARLLGRGAQPHSELSICLPLRRRGLRLIYDPAIVVDHYPAPRTAGDRREDQAREAVFDWTYNETLQVLEYLDAPRRAAFLAWGFAVGTGGSPGLVGALRAGGRDRRARLRAARDARAAALRTWRTTPRALS